MNKDTQVHPMKEELFAISKEDNKTKTAKETRGLMVRLRKWGNSITWYIGITVLKKENYLKEKGTRSRIKPINLQINNMRCWGKFNWYKTDNSEINTWNLIAFTDLLCQAVKF